MLQGSRSPTKLNLSIEVPFLFILIHTVEENIFYFSNYLINENIIYVHFNYY